MKHYKLLQYDKSTGKLMKYQETEESPVFVWNGSAFVEEDTTVSRTRKRRKMMTPELKQLITRMLLNGERTGKIATALDVSAGTVSKIRREL
jgi:DNA-binding NarL/FixJ family response regulator